MADDTVLEILKDIQSRLADNETLGVLNTVQVSLAKIEDRLAQIEAKLEGPMAAAWNPEDRLG